MDSNACLAAVQQCFRSDISVGINRRSGAAAAFGILFDMRLYMHIVLLSVPLQDNEKQMLCKLPHL